MICDPCKKTADYDRSVLDGHKDAGMPRGFLMLHGIRPGHCETDGCSCRHRPVGTIKFETKEAK